MTEDEARRVVLVQAHEPALLPGAAHRDEALQRLWSPEDRAWATRQALAAVGEKATPQAFVVARAGAALQRLLPRAPQAQRWLDRRIWHPAWVVLSLVLGFMGGVLVDQLGPPQRVNLLAPAVWAVVAWNVAVYAVLLLPLPGHGLRSWLVRWTQRSGEHFALLWSRQSAPLTGQRVALVLHLAAAALATGLIAGLYLRGLVLDYRIGWESTFIDAPLVETALGMLLGPASALTGIAIPEVAPLRLAPGAPATASAAPWIHLLATTLLWVVVLPRTLLALVAQVRARHRSRQFRLPLDTPYFESLHPLMRPGLSPQLRLLWVAPADAPPLRLFGQDVHGPREPQLLVRSEEGDELHLLPQPTDLTAALAPAAPGSWWQRWLGGDDARQPQLRHGIDAVLLLARAGEAQPAWLETLHRPVLVLVDSPEAEPPRLSLHARHEGWLTEGRLLQVLEAALPGDPRLPRLRRAWTMLQLQGLQAGVQLVADALGQIAASHEPVADEGLLARRAEAQAARDLLTQRLQGQWAVFEQALAAQLGAPAGGALQVVDEAAAMPTVANAALRGKLGEGRAALVGGVVTGALAGLKADVLSGGMTLGAGLITGGVLGALGAAGMAKGLNVVRGTDRSFAAWDAEALQPIAQGLLQRYLQRVHGLLPEAAAAQAARGLAAQSQALDDLWRSRERRLLNEGEAAQLSRQLQPLLLAAAQLALGGPEGAESAHP